MEEQQSIPGKVPCYSQHGDQCNDQPGLTRSPGIVANHTNVDSLTSAGRDLDQKLFVAIAGNIGTGKTTLTRLLSQRFGWKAHYESVADNPYLADFYADMDRWSFPLQVYFLNNRFRAHQSISNGTNSAIQDRSIYEDANIFARGLYEQGQMEYRDYKNYLELYEVMCDFLQPPDLVIYLQKGLPRLKERIRQRGRDYEREIPDEYLKNLNHYYNDWMSKYELGNKLLVESDDRDFLNNNEDFDWLCRQILANIDQPDMFHTVSNFASA